MRISNRALPIVLLIAAFAWTVATFSPLIYYLFVPNPDIQALVGALEGRQNPPFSLDSLVQQAKAQLGHLRRAIPVGAYYGASATLNIKKSYTTRKVQVCYVAWFEKRPKPGVFFISREETDNSHLNFVLTEGDPSSILRAYGLPMLLLALALFWLWKRPSFLGGDPAAGGEQPKLNTSA
ncbi:MAG TPA: hypothetical protein VMF66_13880 [Candidatus Acidoferrum sp.]|nr:hypothetical protein [Candidatus Acidoferrum sp.]